MLQQAHHTLSNGLQSFAESSPDYIVAPIGLGSLQEQAEHLAEYGRNGDIYVVHAAEGETVVPMEVLDANPKIRELLFDQMRGMGIDPERYIIGNQLNSLNPDTGMPEFFFKSIFKGIKKVVKSVIKVVKKVAPIVIPIAASVFGIPFLGIPAGSFAASFLGSGIGTLIGGGSIKDALKSGLISGGLASLTGGLKGAFSETGTFMGGLEGSFTGMTPVFSPKDYTTPIGHQVGAIPTWGTDSSVLVGDAGLKAGQAASQAQMAALGRGDIIEGLTGGLFGPTGSGTKGFVPLGGTATTASSAIPAPGKIPFDIDAFQSDVAGQNLSGTDLSPRAVSPPEYMYDEPSTYIPVKAVQRLAPPKVEPSFISKHFGTDVDKGLTKAGNLLFGETPSPQTLHRAAAKLIADNPTVYPGSKGAERALEFVTKDLSPGVIRKYGPSLALAGGAAYLAGAFDPPDPEDFDTKEAYLKKFAEFKRANPSFKGNPEKFTLTLRPLAHLDPSGPQFTPSPVGFHGGEALVANGGAAFLANGGAAFSSPRFAAPTSGARFGIPDPEISFQLPTAGDFTSSYPAIPPRPPYVQAPVPAGYNPTDPTSTNTFFDPSRHRVSLFDPDDFSVPEPDPDDPVEPPPAPPPAPPRVCPAGTTHAGTDENGFPICQRFDDPDIGAAGGGFVDESYQPGMYGQRARALVEGPGTERSDEIPARLSDGEFVLTARSVRGADPTGQGDRYRGAQNLYEIMRNFEMRA